MSNTPAMSEIRVGLDVYYRSELIQGVMKVFKNRQYEDGDQTITFSNVTALPGQDGDATYIDVYFRTERITTDDQKMVLCSILRGLIDQLSEQLTTPEQTVNVGWFLEIDKERWDITRYTQQYPGAKESFLVHEHQVILQLVCPIPQSTLQQIVCPTRVEAYQLSIGQPTYIQYEWGWEVFFNVRNEGELFASDSVNEVWNVIQNMLSRLSMEVGRDIDFNCFIDGEAMVAPPEYVYEEVEFVYILEPVVVFTYYDPYPDVILFL